MELPSRSDYADYFNVIRRPVSISILRVRDVATGCPMRTDAAPH